MKNQFEHFTQRDILNSELIKQYLTLDDNCSTKISSLKYNAIVDLKEKAVELKCKTEFNKLLKKCENEINPPKKNMTIDAVYRHIIENYYIKVYQNEIYIFDNNKYVSDEKIIDKLIYQCNENAIKSFSNEVKRKIKILLEEEKEPVNEDLIAFENGILNLNNKKLIHNSPDFFIINTIPCNYIENPSINEPIQKFLNDISCNNINRKQAILEMIGYAMTSSVKKQKAFILYGEKAGNGKSTLLKLIENLIGKENISYISMQNISQDKFTISEIKNKLLNISSEMTKEFLKDISLFKILVTGDVTAIEEKFEKRQIIKPYSKLIFTANELPKVADTTNGFYRRLQIIPFEAEFTEEAKNNFDFNRLIDPKALEYLCSIAVKAYWNMKNTFCNEKESQAIIERYKIENNNVLAYLSDINNLNDFFKNSRTRRKNELYADYKDWCIRNELKVKGNQTFYKEVLQTGKVKEGKKYQGYDTFILK